MVKVNKVIIADDEIIIREGLATMISGFKFPLIIVGEAKNGMEALHLTKMLEPDILLVDICMPKLSGLDFIKQLRESGKSDIKIIIISGFNDFEYARQAISYGVTEYLLKPIKESELKDALKVCIFGVSNVDDINAQIRELYLSEIVNKCLDFLKDNYQRADLDLTTISEILSVNSDYLSRKLKNETGLSFKEWITKLRMQKSIELLKSQKYTIYEIADMVGYSNPHYFSTAFKNYTGYSPSNYTD